MTMTAFDATRKRQRLQADLEAMLATELPVIPEEEPDLKDERTTRTGAIQPGTSRGLRSRVPWDLSQKLHRR